MTDESDVTSRLDAACAALAAIPGRAGPGTDYVIGQLRAVCPSGDFWARQDVLHMARSLAIVGPFDPPEVRNAALLARDAVGALWAVMGHG